MAPWSRYGYGACKGDVDVQLEVGVDIDSCFGCLKRVSESAQVLFNGLEAAMVLASRMLK